MILIRQMSRHVPREKSCMGLIPFRGEDLEVSEIETVLEQKLTAN